MVVLCGANIYFNFISIVKEGIDFKPREDLNMHKSKELESYFIEKIN